MAYPEPEVDRMEKSGFDYSTFAVNSSTKATFQDGGGSPMTKTRIALYLEALVKGTLRKTGKLSQSTDRALAELIAGTYVVSIPVDVQAEGDARDDIYLTHSMYVDDIYLTHIHLTSGLTSRAGARCTCIDYWQARRACKHIFLCMAHIGVLDLEYLLQRVGGPPRRGRPTGGAGGDRSTMFGGVQRAGKNPLLWMGQRSVPRVHTLTHLHTLTRF